MKIPLTQGKFAIVGPRDYKYLMQWKWYYLNGYAIRNGPQPKRRPIRMHRVILERMGFKDFEDSDHVNKDKLDNRRCNLRPATRSQNNCNRSRRSHNTSGYLGVNWHKLTKKWRAYIAIGKKHKHLGLYKTKEKAARAYNDAAKKHYGEFATLNKE